MILNTVTTMTSMSCLLTASKRSNAYLKTVRMYTHSPFYGLNCIAHIVYYWSYVYLLLCLTMFLDKKNEKKKVVADAFLPVNTARDAIQYSIDLYA
ncbi:hypothetical protein DAI22_01g150400 [Oryza sativa Japonica Group]|nr:hypothetical protein DAI22_01g150400 [Oryza sativa Japonica Group]